MENAQFEPKVEKRVVRACSQDCTSFSRVKPRRSTTPPRHKCCLNNLNKLAQRCAAFSFDLGAGSTSCRQLLAENPAFER